MGKRYYEVIGIPGDGHRYKLGFTSNKSACLREHMKNGWQRGQIEFIAKAETGS